MKARVLGIALLMAALSVAAASAQTVAAGGMTLEEFRQYLLVLHLKEADEQGVRLQMESGKAQFPPWWPQSVTDQMISKMLGVDMAAIEFPYVQSCMTSEELRSLTKLFQTPEGQQYANHATGAMVSKEAAGADARTARADAVREDSGLSPKALEHLEPTDRERVKKLMSGSTMGCMNNGLQKAMVALGEERTRVVKELIQERTAQLQAAKQKYEAAQAAPK